MFWAYFKILLTLIIPLCTIAYARQLRLEGDYQRIRSIVERPANLQWMLSHPRETLQLNRAENQYLHHLLQDLDS